MTSLFERLEETAGLPRVVSRPALLRALERAGVEDARRLTPAALRDALDSIHSTLRVYHPEDEAARRLSQVESLTGTEEEGS